jgi:hypothetical protein
MARVPEIDGRRPLRLLLPRNPLTAQEQQRQRRFRQDLPGDFNAFLGIGEDGRVSCPVRIEYQSMNRRIEFWFLKPCTCLFDSSCDFLSQGNALVLGIIGDAARASHCH